MAMLNLQRAFLAFWQQFGVPAYLDGYALEVDAQGNQKAPAMPYITFNYSRGDFLTSTLVTGRVWTRSSSFVPALNIIKLIEKAVPVGGRSLVLDDEEGIVRLFRGTPFIQFQPTDDQMLKVGYILLEARSYVI